MVPPDLDVMRAPSRVYAGCLAETVALSPLRSLRRPARVTAVIGTTLAVCATGHATVPLVFSVSLCWSFIVVAQVLVGLLIIVPADRREVPVPAALDLFFMTHGPWTIWMLAFATLTIVTSAAGRGAMISAVIPAIWTPPLVFAFCRTVLNVSSREALARTAVQQIVTWALAFAAWGSAVALWARIAGLLVR